jgi:hypothetical protein
MVAKLCHVVVVVVAESEESPLLAERAQAAKQQLAGLAVQLSAGSSTLAEYRVHSNELTNCGVHTFYDFLFYF